MRLTACQFARTIHLTRHFRRRGEEMNEAEKLLLALFKLVDSGTFDRQLFEQVREYLGAFEEAE